MSLTAGLRSRYDTGTDDYEVVVSIDLEGHGRRFSERAFEIHTRSGSFLSIDGGLLEGVQIPTRSASVRDATINVGGDASVSLQAEAAEWLRWLAAKFPIQTAAVEIAVVPLPDIDAPEVFWEDRLVVYQGQIRRPNWDLHNDTAGMDISEEAADGIGRVPDRVVVSTQAPDRSQGEPLPILFGSAIFDIAGIVLRESTDDNRILIAGHHVRTTTNAITIHRDNEEGETTTVLTGTAVNGVDTSKRPMSWVVVSDADYYADAPGTDRPFSITLDAPGRLGGTPGAATQKEFRLLGEVLLDLLTTYSAMSLDRLDIASFRSLDTQCPLDVSIQITTEKSVFEWVQTIAQDLPVVVEWVGGKYRAIPAVLGGDTVPAVTAHLVYGREILSMARPYEQDSVTDVFSDFNVRYAYRSREDRFTGVIERNPSTDPVCAASASRWGRRAFDHSVDLWQVEDDATAQRIANEIVARNAILRTHVAFRCEARAVVHLNLLDVVAITDEVHGIIEQLFLIEQIQIEDGATYVLGLASFRELEVVA